jgi:hypothetical protein
MKYSFCFDTSSKDKNSFNMLSVTKTHPKKEESGSEKENIDLYDDKYR